MLSLLQKLIKDALRWRESESYKRLVRDHEESTKFVAADVRCAMMVHAAADARDISRQPELLHDARHQGNEGR